MRIPWRFYDPEEDISYFMEVNPNEDTGSNALQKAQNYSRATSIYEDYSGNLRINDTVISERPDEQEKFSYTGLIYTKRQYDDLTEWFSKPYPWELRDDLKREFLIYVEVFNTERIRSQNFRWKHSYTVSGLVLQELESEAWPGPL